MACKAEELHMFNGCHICCGEDKTWFVQFDSQTNRHQNETGYIFFVNVARKCQRHNEWGYGDFTDMHGVEPCWISEQNFVCKTLPQCIPKTPSLHPSELLAIPENLDNCANFTSSLSHITHNHHL